MELEKSAGEEETLHREETGEAQESRTVQDSEDINSTKIIHPTDENPRRDAEVKKKRGNATFYLSVTIMFKVQGKWHKQNCFHHLCFRSTLEKNTNI